MLFQTFPCTGISWRDYLNISLAVKLVLKSLVTRAKRKHAPYIPFTVHKEVWYKSFRRTKCLPSINSKVNLSSLWHWEISGGCSEENLGFYNNKAISSILSVKVEAVMSNQLNKSIILGLWITKYFKINVILFQMHRVIRIGSTKHC